MDSSAVRVMTGPCLASVIGTCAVIFLQPQPGWLNADQDSRMVELGHSDSMDSKAARKRTTL